MFLSIVPYAIRTYDGKIRPVPTSWSLWSLIGLALLLTYRSSGATANVWPAGYSDSRIPPLITILSLLRREKWKKPNLAEQLCFVFGMVSLALWVFLRNNQELSRYALGLAIVADLCAAIPTIHFVWTEPERDRPFAWVLFGIGYFLVVFAIPENTFANWGLPLYMTAVSFNVALAAGPVPVSPPYSAAGMDIEPVLEQAHCLRPAGLSTAQIINRAGVSAIIARHAETRREAGHQNSLAFTPPRYLAVEGPIRVGKSTLARFLADRMHARRIFDCDDNPFLTNFYGEKKGAAFATQMYFLSERHQRLREALAVESPGAVIADILFEKDKIFAYLNLDNEELKLYERYFERLAAELRPPDLVIYLQATPEVLRERIAKKAAPNESRISHAYIEEVVRDYEHIFFRYSASDLLVVNTSEIDFVNRNEDLQQLLRRLEEPVKGTQYFLPLGTES